MNKQFTDFWMSTPYIKDRFNELFIMETQDPKTFGVAYPVDILFVPSGKTVNGNGLISWTPLGKVIFPGYKMQPLAKEGILYRNIYLKHAVNGKVAHTVNWDWRNADYWNYTITHQKIFAIKECRNLTNLELKESKDIWEYDSQLYHGPNQLAPINIPDSIIEDDVYRRILATGYGYSGATKQTPSNYQSFSSNNSFEIDRLTRQVEQLRNDLHQTRSQLRNEEEVKKELTVELEGLQNELAEVLEKGVPFNNYSIWDIIGCDPFDSKEIQREKTIKAIKQYHPDRVEYSGPIIKRLANEISAQLFEHKKLIERS